jgi:hypothetical protein
MKSKIPSQTELEDAGTKAYLDVHCFFGGGGHTKSWRCTHPDLSELADAFCYADRSFFLVDNQTKESFYSCCTALMSDTTVFSS